MVDSASTPPSLQQLSLTLPHREKPGFTAAHFLPARGLMLLQAQARRPDGTETDILFAPAFDAAAQMMDGGPRDFQGNVSFAFGAAILAPFANRIRGIPSPSDRSIITRIGPHKIKLPANGGAQGPGREPCAIHGLILATPVQNLRREELPDVAQASGVIDAGDFGVGWPSATRLEIRWTLRSEALSLRVLATNIGNDPTPIGLGWHPYFALPSGQPAQGRIRLPARSRIAVNDYEDVFPTGAILPVAGTPYDYQAPGGRSLEDRFLDDCFTDLDPTPTGETICEVIDPAAAYGLRIISPSPQVSAIQTFRQPGRPFVVIEPQFNLANPYGSEWPPGRDTGMVLLHPGEAVSYEARLELFTP